MITAFVILMLFGGGFGGKSLNLSDPAVLAQFQQNVAGIVSDRGRATAVTNAVVQLNEMSWQARNPNGLIENEVQNVRAVASNYTSTQAELSAAMSALETEISRENYNMIQGREVIRRNTTKSEWGKLLKTLSK